MSAEEEDKLALQAVDEINRLHAENCVAARTAFENGQRIGELLTEFKTGLSHGQWLPWLKANTNINERTARNYMRIYRERDRLQIGNVSDLTAAYQLLIDRREPAETGDDGWPRIASNHFGVLCGAFAGRPDECDWVDCDLAVFELLGIPARYGRQAVEICRGDSRLFTAWFHSKPKDDDEPEGNTIVAMKIKVIALDFHEKERQEAIEKAKPVALAIAEMRDKQLYRENYSSFAEYCELKLGMSESAVNERLSVILGPQNDNESQA